MSLLLQYLILTAVLLKTVLLSLSSSLSLLLLLLLLFLWQMVEKLSHHRSGIPVEFDCVLEHLLVGIEFRAMLQMFLIHGAVWHLPYCALT
jgi:hypothetical protein